MNKPAATGQNGHDDHEYGATGRRPYWLCMRLVRQKRADTSCPLTRGHIYRQLACHDYFLDRSIFRILYNPRAVICHAYVVHISAKGIFTMPLRCTGAGVFLTWTRQNPYVHFTRNTRREKHRTGAWFELAIARDPSSVSAHCNFSSTAEYQAFSHTG